jgi:hypothetical protein
MELITEREVARRLASARGLSRSATQHLLATGIAGRPIRTGGVALFDAERVRSLLELPPVRADEFEALASGGLVIVRLPRDRTVDASLVWPDTRAALVGPWRLRSQQWTLLWLRTFRERSLPMLLTVSAHVVCGATLNGFTLRDGDDAAWFDLHPPGPWLHELVGRRVRGHRGPQVELLDPPPALPGG